MTDIVPIRVVAGDDWVLPFTYKDPDGNPIDLTGFQAGGDLAIPGGSVAMTGTIADQGSARGQFLLQIARNATANLPQHQQGTHLRAFLISPSGVKTSFPRWPVDVDGR